MEKLEGQYNQMSITTEIRSMTGTEEAHVGPIHVSNDENEDI